MDWQEAAVLREQLDKSRGLILRHMDSLRQIPDALDRTKDLFFFDTWTSDYGLSLGKYASTGRTAEELLLPLLSRLTFFVLRCPLETLHWQSQELPGIIWDAARSCSTLRTMTINARVPEDPHNWSVIYGTLAL